MNRRVITDWIQTDFMMMGFMDVYENGKHVEVGEVTADHENRWRLTGDELIWYNNLPEDGGLPDFIKQIEALID